MDRERLIEGLRNADAAGDVAAARALAQALRGTAAPAAPAKAGIAEGVAHGMLRPVMGGLQGLVRLLPQTMVDALAQDPFEDEFAERRGAPRPQAPPGTVTPQATDRVVRGLEADYQRRRNSEGVDWPVLAGEMISLAPLAAALPGAGATLMGTAARAVPAGAALGTLMPATDARRPYGEQLRENVLTSAATMGAVAPGVQAAGRALAPRVAPAVQALMQRGVTPTPGQILGRGAAAAEEGFSAMPFVGSVTRASQRRALEDFNRAAYDEVLKPLGTTYDGPVGQTALRRLHVEVGKQYDDIVPDLRAEVDTDLIAAADEIYDEAAKGLSKGHRRFLDRALEVSFPEKMPMVGENVRAISDSLDAQIAKFAKSTAPEDGTIREALAGIKTAFMENVARHTPQHAERLGKINEAYRSLVRVETAARKQTDALFTPDDLFKALQSTSRTKRAADVTRGLGGPLQDLASAGGEVLGSAGRQTGDAGLPLAVALGAGAMAGPGYLAGAAALSAPYTPFGQRLAARLLTQRPGSVRAAGEAVERGALGGAGAGALYGEEEDARGRREHARWLKRHAGR